MKFSPLMNKFYGGYSLIAGTFLSYCLCFEIWGEISAIYAYLHNVHNNHAEAIAVKNYMVILSSPNILLKHIFLFSTKEPITH